MATAMTWLDYSERDRRQVLDVLHALKERETRDELGLGLIRDGFANTFFPGTSVVQTRKRYFLFVPWICKSRQKVQSSGVRGRMGRGERCFIGFGMGCHPGKWPNLMSTARRSRATPRFGQHPR